MSGSPKWAEIQLEQERQRKLEEERLRRAEEERLRREEAERRARAALALALKQALGDEVAQLQGALRRARAAQWAEEIPGGIPYLEPKLERLLGEAGHTPEQLAAALARARGWTAQVQSLFREGQDRMLRQEEEAQALREEAMSAAARLRAEEGAWAREREALAAAQAVEDRLASVAALEVGLQMRLRGIEADEITPVWEEATLGAVAQEAGDLANAAAPEAAASALHRRLDEILDRAQRRQLAEERRAYIVESLRAALQAQGFQVGAPVLLGSQGMEGDVVFRAARVDRSQLDVSVGMDGPVIYTIDGVEERPEQGADGVLYSHCDGAEEGLLALHQDLDARFGLQAGELLWEAKDPNRLTRTAQGLPTGTSAAKRYRGES